MRQQQTTRMKNLVQTALVFACFQSFASERVISKKEYVESWKHTAIEQMMDHQIPASITLAQAILESGSGNSELARKGNNHFGIKCHDWKGKKMHIDDDEKQECFRVYRSAEESYEDHSLFLKDHQRYASLFYLDVTDYKSWAKGLKKAGYATNPKYDDLLINLIEELNLSLFDQLMNPEVHVQSELKPEKENNKNLTEMVKTHRVYKHSNRVNYIIAEKGDTYYSISKEFGLTLHQLYKYNSFDAKKEYLVPGDFIYIQPKRRRKIGKKDELQLTQNMSIIELSQKYAVHQKAIIRLNRVQENEVFVKGEKVILR